MPEGVLDSEIALVMAHMDRPVFEVRYATGPDGPFGSSARIAGHAEATDARGMLYEGTGRDGLATGTGDLFAVARTLVGRD